MDQSLQSFARAYILRAHTELDPRRVEDYLASEAFRNLAAKFAEKIDLSLNAYLGVAPARAAPDVQPRASANPAATQPAAKKMPFPELTPTPAPVPAARPAPMTTPAAAPTACPPVPPVPAMPPIPPMPPAPPMPPTPPMPPLPPAAPAPAPAPVPAPAPALPPAAPQPEPPARPAPAPAPQPELPDAVFRLPNARAGTGYLHKIEAADGGEAIVLDEVLVPAGLGCSADLASATLGGTPAAAGDYTLTVRYHYARQSPARKRQALVQLSVIPDPRAMWKNLPSDRNAPYFKEDEACASLAGKDFAIVAASKRGRSHAHVGSFRDDDFRIDQQAATGWTVAAVADGAGSARYSRRGAEIICEEARKRILASLTDSTSAQIDAAAQAYAGSGALPPEARAAAADELHTHLSRVVGNAAYYAVLAIHGEVGNRPELGGMFKDYSSTALIAICKRYPFGTLCAAYWVGDGAIGVYSRRDGITLLGEVDSGEFSGQTRFLDNAAVDHVNGMLQKRTRFALVEDMTALVLMTDGVSDAKFETEARLGRDADWHAFWEELDRAACFGAHAPDAERKLLDWLDFWSQGNHDDRTIAVIY